MNLATVMTEIAAQLDTIDGLRVYAFPPDSVAPPAAVVSYPEGYDYDATYQRGADSVTLPVVVVVGKPSDRSTVERLGKYADGSGPFSVKQVVEAGNYTAFEAVRVMDVDFDAVDIGGTTYMAALFSLDIGGKGAL